ncbi:hypothetical protein D3C81_2277540 [compost metagenome]
MEGDQLGRQRQGAADGKLSIGASMRALRLGRLSRCFAPLRQAVHADLVQSGEHVVQPSSGMLDRELALQEVEAEVLDP